MSNAAKVKNKGRKIGRGNSAKWVHSGGEDRRNRRATKNHGCGLLAFHRGGKNKRDVAHSTKKPTIQLTPTLAVQA
jgi:RIO-like serine/threonine protein kinase